MMVVANHGLIENAKKPRKFTRSKYFLYPIAGERGSQQRKSVRAKHPVKLHAERENESREEYHPPARNLVAAIMAVTATYAYFLVFAQFGFLHALTAALGEGHALLRPVLATMGTAGIAGSIIMAKGCPEQKARVWMMVGFGVAGTAAGLAWIARTPPLFFVIAALTGAGTGIVTVGLAGMIGRETGGNRLGLGLGLGTGLAYALCNLPPVFAAAPRTQALFGLGAAALGLVAMLGFAQRAPLPPVRGFDYEPRGIALWTLILLALVSFDSAAFYVIQHTPALKDITWSTEPQLWLNAMVHFVAAALAGLALDRLRLVSATLIATALLWAGSGLIFTGKGMVGASLYAAGVSIYSTVLVFYPARSGRITLAALIYAVAGWIGSAMGIGVAEGFGWLPIGWLMLPAAVGGLFTFRCRNVQ